MVFNVLLRFDYVLLSLSMFLKIVHKLVQLSVLPSYGCRIGSDSSSSIPAKFWLVGLRTIWLFELEKNVLVYDESCVGFRDYRYFLFFKLILSETLLWTDTVLMVLIIVIFTFFSIKNRIPSPFTSKFISFQRSKIHNKILSDSEFTISPIRSY